MFFYELNEVIYECNKTKSWLKKTLHRKYFGPKIHALIYHPIQSESKILSAKKLFNTFITSVAVIFISDSFILKNVCTLPIYLCIYISMYLSMNIFIYVSMSLCM